MIKKVSLSLATAMLLFGADTKLNTTVVSTTGYEENLLKDEIKNVIVIPKEEIQNKGYRDVKEVLERAPSVSIIDLGFGTVIDMRGQGSKANTNTKILVNGIDLGMLEAAHVQPILDLVPVDDIEKIEIILGGGSILYGSGTTGGVINIITKTKPKDFYGNISTKWGSYNYKDINFGIGGKVTDNLFLKLNGKVFNTKGYRRGYSNKGKYISGGLNYQINDNQSLSLYGSFYDSKVKEVDSLTKAELDRDRRQEKFSPYSSKRYDVEKRTNITLDYALKYGDLVDLRITPYYQQMRFYDVDIGGGWMDYKKGINIKNRSDYGKGDLFYGYEFLMDKGDRTTAKLRKTTNSVFILDKHNFTDSFILSTGLRGQHDIFDIKDPSKKQDGTKGENHWAFEIMPQFKYSDTGSAYARFDKGYVSPGTNQKTSKFPPKNYVLNDLKSETFYTYELGIKDYINNVYFSATAFMTDKKDEIKINWLRFPQYRGLFWEYKNIDKSRRYGIELYSEQYIIDGDLKFSESYSYVKPKITSGPDKGKEIPLVSKHKLTLGVDYKIIKPLSVFGDLIYYSWAYDDNYDKADSHAVVNIGASYDIYKGFLVSGGIKNLLDKKYNSYSNIKDDSYYPADGRNFYVEFKYKY